MNKQSTVSVERVDETDPFSNFVSGFLLGVLPGCFAAGLCFVIALFAAFDQCGLWGATCTAGQVRTFEMLLIVGTWVAYVAVSSIVTVLVASRGASYRPSVLVLSAIVSQALAGTFLGFLALGASQ